MPASQNVQGLLMVGSGQHTSSASWILRHKGVLPFTVLACSFNRPHVCPFLPGISKASSIIPASQNWHLFSSEIGGGVIISSCDFGVGDSDIGMVVVGSNVEGLNVGSAVGGFKVVGKGVGVLAFASGLGQHELSIC